MTVAFDPFLHEYTDEETKVVFISVTQLLQKHGISPDYGHVDKVLLEQAAERGTLVHSHFETSINSNGQDDSNNPVVRKFLDEIYPRFTDWKSETMVFIDGVANRGVDLAGTIDLICKSRTGRWMIGDIKTTSTLHRETVAWQLTLYRMMWCYLNHVSVSDVDLFCLHIKDGDVIWHDVTPIAQSEIDMLMECEADDIPYCRSRELDSLDVDNRILAYERKLVELNREVERIKALEEQAKNQIYSTLMEKGVTTLDTPNLHISVIAPTTSTTIDSKKLKAEMPEIYDKYSKQSQRKGYIKIEVKNG